MSCQIWTSLMSWFLTESGWPVKLRFPVWAAWVFWRTSDFSHTGFLVKSSVKRNKDFHWVVCESKNVLQFVLKSLVKFPVRLKYFIKIQISVSNFFFYFHSSQAEISCRIGIYNHNPALGKSGFDVNGISSHTMTFSQCPECQLIWVGCTDLVDARSLSPQKYLCKILQKSSDCRKWWEVRKWTCHLLIDTSLTGLGRSKQPVWMIW